MKNKIIELIHKDSNEVHRTSSLVLMEHVFELKKLDNTSLFSSSKNSDEISTNYCNAKSAKEYVNYSAKYLTNLARQNKVYAVKFGNEWFFEIKSLIDYAKKKNRLLKVPEDYV